MSYFSGKNIWITGASSGIGESLAYELARQGAFIILSARREEELLRVKKNIESLGAGASICVLDLGDVSSLSLAVNFVVSSCKKIDILINNGGISQRSLVVETSDEVERRIMEVNFFGAVKLSKLVLSHMLTNHSGHIVVVSSITGKFGFSLRSAYSASKHALHGYFEALRNENYDKGISVTLVCPGRVHTNISFHALTGNNIPHGIMDHGQDMGISAEACARKIVHAIKKRKKEVLVGGREILMVYIKRFLPFLFYKLVVKVKPK